MGRRRGGYLGGSTIINPRMASQSTDEGPVAALERGRIEKLRAEAEKAHKQQAYDAASERLTSIEKTLHHLVVALEYNFPNEAQTAVNDIANFLSQEAENLAETGPNARRRLHVIRDDYALLVDALSVEKSEQFALIWKTTVYQTRIYPIIDAAWRKASRRSD